MALTAGVVAWPLAVRAQQQITPVIGVLGGTSPSEWVPYTAGFNRGLKQAGYVDGVNVKVEYRWANNHYDQFPALTADLVDRRVSVIVAIGGTPSALAAKNATSVVPIIFLVGRDPVALGLVASINRPGGNATGITLPNDTLAPKRFELLRELIPRITVIGVVQNQDNPVGQVMVSELQVIARAAGLQVLSVSANNDRDLNTAFANLARNRADAIVIAPDPYLDTRRDQLVALAAAHRMPAIYQWREFVDAGGLVSYGTSLADAHRQVGVYTGSILNGTKPADLPVFEPTRYDLVLNLKTAKALGLMIPPTLLARADDVIE